jgi:hypothetical protein
MSITEHITDGQWMLYASGKLGADELTLLEAHLAGCPVCSDIAEGIKYMPQAEKLSERVAVINERVDAALKPKIKRIAMHWYWNAAAIILISFGLGWWLLSTPANQVVENEKNMSSLPDSLTKTRLKEIPEQPKPAEISPDSKNEFYIKKPAHEKETSLDQNVNGNKGSDVEPEKDMSAGAGLDNTMVEDKSLSKVPERVDSTGGYALNNKVQDKEADSISNVIAFNSVGKMTANGVFSRSSDNPAVQSDSKSMKEIELKPASKQSKHKPAASESQKDMDSYNYTSVPSAIQSPAMSDSTTLNNAKIAYDAGQYNSCLSDLKFITQNPNSVNYEDAMYLKAKTLMMLDKKSEAKKTLNTLIRYNGKMKYEAQKLLNALN